MKYETPSVVVLGTAHATVQGAGKGSTNLEIDRQETNPAYEADE